MRKGKQLVQAPEYGVQASVTYTLQNGNRHVRYDRGHVNYQSLMYADAQNEFEIPERTLLGLTEQWTSNDGNTYVTVWGKTSLTKFTMSRSACSLRWASSAIPARRAPMASPSAANSDADHPSSRRSPGGRMPELKAFPL